MIKKHKDNIRNDSSNVASVSRMSSVTPWLGFPGFCGYAFDEFCTADVFYASDDDLFWRMFFCDIFRDGYAAIHHSKRLIAYVWVHESRRRIPDSKNLHVMSEGYHTYGRAVANTCACILNIFPTLSSRPSVRSCHECPLYLEAVWKFLYVG